MPVRIPLLDPGLINELTRMEMARQQMAQQDRANDASMAHSVNMQLPGILRSQEEMGMERARMGQQAGQFAASQAAAAQRDRLDHERGLAGLAQQRAMAEMQEAGAQSRWAQQQAAAEAARKAAEVHAQWERTFKEGEASRRNDTEKAEREARIKEAQIRNAPEYARIKMMREQGTAAEARERSSLINQYNTLLARHAQLSAKAKAEGLSEEEEAEITGTIATGVALVAQELEKRGISIPGAQSPAAPSGGSASMPWRR